MAKRKGDQPNSQAQDQTGSEPSQPVTPSETAEAALPTPPKIAAADAVSPAKPAPAATATATSDAPPVAAAIAAPKLEAASSDPVKPQPEDIRTADVRPDATSAPAAAYRLSSWSSSASWTRARRLAPLAATAAIAAALGAMVGSMATAGMGSVWAGDHAAKTADAWAVKQSIMRLNNEVAALKASIDSSAKSASAQFIKLGDRFDRVERAQAEPAAKLVKLTEAVDRIERRAPAASAVAAHDVTGSVAAYAPPPPATVEPTPAASPPVLEGWRVRSVYNGAALIQGRLGGVMEVEPGDNLPGLGRIESIRRQDGKWVVVTSKGLIVAR